MLKEEFERIEQGDGLIVGFGLRGSQIATALGWTRVGTLYVAKWSKASKRWTKRVRLDPGDVRRRSRNYQHDGLPAGDIPKLREGLLTKKPN